MTNEVRSAASGHLAPSPLLCRWGRASFGNARKRGYILSRLRELGSRFVNQGRSQRESKRIPALLKSLDGKRMRSAVHLSACALHLKTPPRRSAFASAPFGARQDPPVRDAPQIAKKKQCCRPVALAHHAENMQDVGRKNLKHDRPSMATMMSCIITPACREVSCRQPASNDQRVLKSRHNQRTAWAGCP
jgi:hypothetical protein